MGLNYQAAVNITAQFSGQGAVNQANQSFQKLQGTINGTSQLSKGLATSFGALGATFAAGEVLSYAKGIIDLGHNFDELQKKTGINVQTLSDLSAAAKNNGVGIDELEGGLKKFSLTVGKADAGITQAKAGFDVLGISLKDSEGHYKTNEELLFTVADRFSQIKDGANKTAVAVSLFGKSGADMIPVLDQGSSAIKGLGIQMSQDFVEQSTEFNKQFEQASRNSKQLGVDIAESTLPALNRLLTALNSISEAMKTAFSESSIDAASKRLDDTGGLAGIFQRLINNKVDILKVALSDTTKSFEKLFNGITGGGFSLKNQSAGQGAGTAAAGTKTTAQKSDVDASNLNPAINAIDTRIAKIRAEAVELNTSNAAKRTAIELADLSTKGIDKNSAAYARLSTAIKSAVYQAEAAKEKQTAADYLQKNTQENDIQKLALDQSKYTTAEYEKMVAAKKLDLQVTEATKRMTADGAAAYRDAAAAVREQTEALIDLQEQQKASFGEGAREAWHDYLEAAKNVAAQTKSMFTKAFSGMEDVVVKFVKTGELSFAQLASQIEDDLIRIAYRQALVFGASAIFGGASGAAGGAGSAGAAGAASGGFNLGVDTSMPAFAKGGIMTEHGPVALRKYANGGIANSPQLALFGEGSGPEAYVPLPDGRSIPVSMDGHSGGSVTIQVNVQTDGSISTQSSGQDANQTGAKLGNLIANAVKNQIIQEKRPGGLLATGA